MVLAAFAMAVVPCHLTAQTRQLSTEQETQMIERLRSAIEYEVAAKRLPAFSIALIDDQRVVWADGFGFQDAEQKIPATAATVYRVGSVSKLFTDVAVMQLVEKGELDLDDPVRKLLPGFAPRNQFNIPITLRQLMSHRSGLVREPPVGHYFDPDEPTLMETVASLNQTQLVYKPRVRTKYSNAGVAVVGAVLQRQTGIEYFEQIERSILKPLQMADSSFVLTDDVDKKLADAQMWTYDGRRFPAPKFALGTSPAGNMYSSVVDLSKFVMAVLNGGAGPNGAIVKPATLERMLTPLKNPDGSDQGFGIGFHVEQLDGHRKVGHGGAVYGFSTQLEILTEPKLGVAAVASLDGSNGLVGRLADYALRLMLAAREGRDWPEYRTTVAIPEARAAELVGAYRRGKRLTLINRLGDDVFMHRGTYRYNLRADRRTGEIITDDSIGFGTPVSLTEAGDVSVDGEVFERLPDRPPAEIPQRWKGLIGEYGWDHNTLYIREEHGRLMALIEWFYDYPLTEVDENTFAFPDYGLYHGERLIFTRDETGRATQVVAAEVRFERREVGTRDGETFKITPVRPIDELRSGALAAKPPPEPGDYRDPDHVELTAHDPTIKLDIRYASTNNFTGAVFYQQPRAFMQRPAAEAVVEAHQSLRRRGLGLLIHDAYRPWFVTKMFWDATPEELRDFVANPERGSRHNRGCAVDLTLYDLRTGRPIEMVAGYDEFSSRSFPLYPGGTSRQRYYRDLLRRTMERHGFSVYEYEWWHFDYHDWKSYRIGNQTFEQLLEQ